MKRRLTTLTRCLFIFWLASFVHAQEFRIVRQGIEHGQITRGVKSADGATGPWVINLLRVDLRKADIRLQHAMDEAVGLETTSSMAARYGAVAAINAGFFTTSGTYRGDAAGVLKVNGKLLSEPALNRVAVGFVNERHTTEIIFGHLQFDGSVETLRGKHQLNGINRQRGANELMLFTPEFHRTTLTTPEGVEIIVRRNRIAQIKDRQGSSIIPADGYVLSASGAARDWALRNLRVGERLRIRTELVAVEKAQSEKWRRAEFVVGGVPQLIKDGRIEITHEQENIRANFVTDRHPRTAIAKLKDGRLLLMTVDGRQPGYSAGMGLRQLAEILLEFGAIEAINLDGGGSTTMVVEGKVVNKPSDATGERAVSDALLIVERGYRIQDSGVRITMKAER
ncbi:MAG: phosphodiester glycosidase family protein [Acidobacteriota bacterium]